MNNTQTLNVGDRVIAVQEAYQIVKNPFGWAHPCREIGVQVRINDQGVVREVKDDYEIRVLWDHSTFASIIVLKCVVKKVT